MYENFLKTKKKNAAGTSFFFNFNIKLNKQLSAHKTKHMFYLRSIKIVQRSTS